MSEDKKAARLKEIEEYLNILANDRLLTALPEGALIELHQALGTAVSVIQHMEEGED
jgi:hypothetical protein